MNNNKKGSVRGSKPVKSPVATRTARSPQRRKTAPSSNTSNIGLIAGLTVLGLLVGGGIAAGTIHAIKPLDGESVNPDTYIEKSKLETDGLYKTTGSGNSLEVSEDVSNDYIEKNVVNRDYTLNDEISKKSILKSTLDDGGLYKATGTGDALALGDNVFNDYTLNDEISKKSILKSTLEDGGLYKATGTDDALTLGDNVLNDYTLNDEISKKSILKSTLEDGGLYKATGTDDALTLGDNVLNDYTLNDEISKKSILKSTLTTGHLYKATGTGDELTLGTNVNDQYTLTADITKTFVTKTGLEDGGLYEATGTTEENLVLGTNVRNLYTKTEDITKTFVTKTGLDDGGLYEATGTGEDLVLGTNVRNSYTKTAEIEKTYFPKSLITEDGLYKSSGSGETRTVADVKDLYTENAKLIETHIPRENLTVGNLYIVTDKKPGAEGRKTLGDVTSTYVKKPTDEDQTFTFKFDTKSEITLNLDGTSSSDDQTTIDPISSQNTSLSDDPEAVKSLSEIKLKVGETKTLYLTSKKQTGKTSPFITKNFFIGVRFTIKLVDSKGKYEISTPSVTPNTFTSDVVRFRTTRAAPDFSLIWNDLPRTEANRLVIGSTTASLDPIISSTVRNSITIGDTDYFAAETVSNNLNDLYTITKEDVNEAGALIRLGQGTDSIIKGNYKLYGSEGHSIDSLELTRISSTTPKKFYLVAPLLPSEAATLVTSGQGTVVILTLSISKQNGVLTGVIDGSVRRRTVANITTYGDFSSKSAGWEVVNENDPLETFRLTTRSLTREMLDYLFVQNSLT